LEADSGKLLLVSFSVDTVDTGKAQEHNQIQCHWRTELGNEYLDWAQEQRHEEKTKKKMKVMMVENRKKLGRKKGRN